MTEVECLKIELQKAMARLKVYRMALEEIARFPLYDSCTLPMLQASGIALDALGMAEVNK